MKKNILVLCGVTTFIYKQIFVRKKKFKKKKNHIIKLVLENMPKLNFRKKLFSHPKAEAFPRRINT